MREQSPQKTGRARRLQAVPEPPPPDGCTELTEREEELILLFRSKRFPFDAALKALAGKDG